MGNTCYISVILQSLVHAPLFRDYFLSLQHKCNAETQAYESQVTENPPSCFACEITDIVREVSKLNILLHFCLVYHCVSSIISFCIFEIDLLCELFVG